ncbi:hypothetical protein MOD71_18655 [Bacillus haynesii]|uniref:hypothetical protein n=1 Tax=Bacillus haynesii TaxID=1925021 RepID=UPI002281DAFA|nr:hypothetical protein [Bacillus haynesii]MCY8737528.1 hypothetical protein [Bacillus haynesii]
MAVKGFYHLADSWYREELKNAPYVDVITIGLYEDDNGTDGEFEIKWSKLNNEIVAHLEAFNDSWVALNQCLDLIQSLKDAKNITPDECVKLLLKLGYKDYTNRENPKTSS